MLLASEYASPEVPLMEAVMPPRLVLGYREMGDPPSAQDRLPCDATEVVAERIRRVRAYP